MSRKKPTQRGRANTHGGARPGAGRPRKQPGRVGHVARPSHTREHPLHVTLRIVRGVRNLRGAKVFRAVRGALGNARTRFGMRLVHYSVQSNHLHLIVEAADRRALTRGMQGLAIRIARRVNASAGRTGRLFNDRYHARALRTPLDVRRVLVYVLRNDQRHWAQGRLSLPPWQLDLSERSPNSYSDSAYARARTKALESQAPRLLRSAPSFAWTRGEPGFMGPLTWPARRRRLGTQHR